MEENNSQNKISKTEWIGIGLSAFIILIIVLASWGSGSNSNTNAPNATQNTASKPSVTQNDNTHSSNSANDETNQKIQNLQNEITQLKNQKNSLPINTTQPAATPGLANAPQYTQSVIELRCPNVLSYGDIIEGSGTIIDRNGYILTNKHLLIGYINQGVLYAGFVCIVYTADKDNLSSVKPSYIAYPISILRDYDAAILRIIKDNNGVFLDPPFNFTPLTVSDRIPQIGEQIHAIGYPAIGQLTFNFTSGEVAGFYSPSGHNYIKISPSIISHGNSGGALIDNQGYLIGIPTAIYSDEGGSIGYALETYDIYKWINFVLRNTQGISSQDILNRNIDIINNPYPVVNSYRGSTNQREFVITGRGFCDYNAGVSTLEVGSYAIPDKDIVSWSDTKIDFFVPTNIPSATYSLNVRGYQTGVGYCTSVNAGGITIN